MKYEIRWTETTDFYLKMEAENKEDAEKKFSDGDYNPIDIENQEGTMDDGSLEITEAEE